MFAFMAVETDIPWTEQERVVDFEGRPIKVRPATSDRRADIVVEYGDGETLQDAASIGNAFLSQLAWHAKLPVRVDQYFGASFPGSGISTMHSQHVSSDFRVDFKPVPVNTKQRLALALFREAKGIKSVPYAVLAFYKVIKLLFPKDKRGRIQMDWINGKTDTITEHRAATRLKELVAAGEDIGKYIYADVRCAIAHANQAPTVNPDNSNEIVQLQGDLPLVEAVARYAIEHELGIKSDDTFRREHRYELEGFRSLLDLPAVKGLTTKAVLMTKLPKLEVSIKMRDKLQLSAFQCLLLKQIESHGTHAVRLTLVSMDGLVHVVLVLDRAMERMHFDPLNGASIADDGSATAAQYEMDRHRIIIDWLSNGETEVHSLDGELLGRSDPYIPENIDFFHTVRSFQEALEAIRVVYSKRVIQQLGGL